MKKRGPKPRSDEPSVVVAFRVSKSLRDSLESAARSHGVKVSREAQDRLTRTLSEERRIEDLFGDERTFALMKMIAALVGTIRRPDNPKADWLTDRWLFGQVLFAINSLLLHYEPLERDVPPPNELRRKDYERVLLEIGAIWASEQAFDAVRGRVSKLPGSVSEDVARLVESVADTDPPKPLEPVTREKRRVADIKKELGALARRPLEQPMMKASRKKRGLK